MAKDVTRLGIYMRTIGRALHPSKPIDSKAAYLIINYTDEGYASATLVRLRDRGIAEEIAPGQFVRHTAS